MTDTISDQMLRDAASITLVDPHRPQWIMPLRICYSACTPLTIAVDSTDEVAIHNWHRRVIAAGRTERQSSDTERRFLI